MSTIQRTQRRNAVKGALFMTQDTPLAPTLYERKLLAQFIRGTLTIDQVVVLTAKQS